VSFNDDLDPDQLVELEQIFRAEGLEHVKRLAEILFEIEEKGAEEELLIEAFRQAHNLKGSAALLGFERVARLTHRIEDVIGMIKRGDQTLTPATMDLLLGGLDVIREGVNLSKPGDDTLTIEEQATLTTLEQWLAACDTSPTPSPPTETRSEVDKVVVQAPETSPPRTMPEPTRSAPEGQDAFIRVAIDALNSLTAQVDDLFEAQVQAETMGQELSRLRHGLDQLLTGVQTLRSESTSSVADDTEDLANLMSVRLEAATEHFHRDMQGLSRRIRKAQEEVGRMGLATLDSLHVKLRRQVREVSRTTNKPVELRFQGGEYAVDRRVLDALTEPLVHLIRNAVDHGIESEDQRQAAGKPPTGLVEVRARHLGDSVELSIRDDGRGIDLVAVRHTLVEAGRPPEEVDELTDDQLTDRLFDSGFSTQRQVSEVSGRGVGLDVVKHTMDRVGGEVRLETSAGQGTTISLRLPLSMSTVRCLLVSLGNRPLAIPAANVQKVLILRPADLLDLGHGEVVEFGGGHVPVTPLQDLIGMASPTWAPQSTRTAVVLQFGDRRWALTVDDVLEYTQIIVKPLGDLLERVPAVSGIALLGDGDLALVLNPGDLVRAAGSRAQALSAGSATPDTSSEMAERVILVVDDSIATRSLERSLLESAGYKVLTATDGFDALDVLGRSRCDLVITDAQMPHMDGFELTRALKSHATLAHLPVIMITSLGSQEDIAQGMASGADAYVVKKNLTQHELVSTINQLL